MHQSLEKCMRPAVAGGVDQKAFTGWLDRSQASLQRLRDMASAKALPLLGLPGRNDDFAEIREVAEWLHGAKQVVFLGTGGSSLGGQTLAQVAGWHIQGLHRGGPDIAFLDNLDPQSLKDGLASLPLHETRFLAISKSGGTGETLIQTIAAIEALQEAGLGAEIKEHIMGLSEPVKPGGSNKLRALLEPFDVTFFEHDPGVGGRYSALSNVGLIPAALVGLDIAEIRLGAADALAPILKGDAPANCDAAVGAALSLAAADAGLATSVMWAYADRLERFTRWYVQLWSESLGKNGQGSTPVAAVGPVDQHSQLQLFLDGPADKLVTMIMVDGRGQGPKLSTALSESAGEPGFADRHVGDFVWAQQCATADTLAKNGKPVRTILLETVDARAIGRLLMHFMLETIIAADLMGVDAFDQPAVEEGKVLAKQLLSQS